jgi:hypothetical protein
VDLQSHLRPKACRCSCEELLLSQVIQQEAVTRLLVEKGVFAKEELLDMVKAVDSEMKKKQKGGRIT